MKKNIDYTDYWMTAKRCKINHFENMRRLHFRVFDVLESEELAEATKNIGIWPSLVVDEELPAGFHRVSRARKPPMWTVFVVIPFAWLADADEQRALGYFIDAWKIALAECFRRVKLSSSETERLLAAVDAIRHEDVDSFPVTKPAD